MEHYFTPKPTSEFRTQTIKGQIRGMELKFTTGSGVFSLRELDKGSILLTDKCLMESDWKVLDLGCGYGTVGLAIAKSLPNTKVFLTDINERATQLSRMNLKYHNIKNGHVVTGDGFEKVNGKFDTILFNPPQTAGRDLCIKLIKEAKDYLLPDGTLQIVVRHKKGGKFLSELMGEFYGNMEVIAKKSGFRIYVSRNQE